MIIESLYKNDGSGKKEKLSYREAGIKVQNKVVNASILSYNDFINNRLGEILSQPIIVDGRVKIDLSNYRIDRSTLVSKNIAKREALTREFNLMSLAKIELIKENIVLEVDITLCKIPQIDNTGVFTIDGVDRVMVHHLGLANIFSMALDKNKEKIIKFISQLNSELAIKEDNNEHLLTVKFGQSPLQDIVANKRISISLQALLEELGYAGEAESIIGSNPNLKYSFISTEQKRAVSLDAIKSLVISSSERRQINSKFSLERKAQGYRLSRDVKTDKIIAKAGEIITPKITHKFTTNNINKIYIDTPYGEYPCMSNNMVELENLINDGLLNKEDIPNCYIIKNLSEYSVADLEHTDEENENEKEVDELRQSGKRYTKVNLTLVKGLIEEAKEEGKDLKNLLEYNYRKVVGLELTDDDLLALINSYSLFIAGVYEKDDIDSLDNKKLTSLADMLSTLLYDVIFGKSRYLKIQGLVAKYREYIATLNIQSKEAGMKTKFINIFGRDPFEDNPPSLADAMKAGGLEKLFQVEANISATEEISMKRKITQQAVEGLGGVSSESTDASPRGVKMSHLSRLCCIETSEGGSVGLVLHLASLAKVDQDGYILAPFFKVDKKNKVIDTSLVYYMKPYEEEMYIRNVSANIANSNNSYISLRVNGFELKTISIIAQAVNNTYTKKQIAQFEEQAKKELKLLQNECDRKIEGLERQLQNAQTPQQAQNIKAKLETARLNKPNQYKVCLYKKDWFKDEVLDAYKGKGELIKCFPEDIDYVACSPSQILSITSGTIPFNPYSDGVRQLMGSQMQKQSEPIIGSEPSTIRTNMQDEYALHTGAVKVAPFECRVVKVDSKEIIVKSLDDGKEETIPLDMEITSEKAIITYKPVVIEGDIKMTGELLADSTSTDHGETKFGMNLRIGYCIYNGYNYEDSIVINSRLLKDESLTSYRSKTYTCLISKDDGDYECMDYGNLEISNYDKTEIQRLNFTKDPFVPKGTIVSPGTPLMAYLSSNKDNKSIINLRKIEFDEDLVGIVASTTRREIIPGRQYEYEIVVATEEPIQLGDKLSGRFGNKGVLGRIVSNCEMYYTDDGQPLDILLTPLGVPSRMNLGQLLEVPLAGILNDLGLRGIVDTCKILDIPKIKKLIQDYYGDKGKVVVYDGVTGEPLKNRVTVGIMTVGKLKHLSSHKLASRGERTTTTLNHQPPAGKKNKGGKKSGEMEQNSYFSHGASNVMRELMSKSDDIVNARLIKLKKKEQVENSLAKGVEDYTLKDLTLNTSESAKQAFKMLAALGVYMENYDEYGNKVDFDIPSINNTGSYQQRNLDKNNNHYTEYKEAQQKEKIQAKYDNEDSVLDLENSFSVEIFGEEDDEITQTDLSVDESVSNAYKGLMDIVNTHSQDIDPHQQDIQDMQDYDAQDYIEDNDNDANIDDETPDIERSTHDGLEMDDTEYDETEDFEETQSDREEDIDY